VYLRKTGLYPSVADAAGRDSPVFFVCLCGAYF
jgi:hypothetical protein